MSGVQPLPVAPNGVAVIGKVMVCHEVDTPSNVPPWLQLNSNGYPSISIIGGGTIKEYL